MTPPMKNRALDTSALLSAIAIEPEAISDDGLSIAGTAVERIDDMKERKPAKSIIGDSAPMRQLVDMVSRIAPRDITVLVRGESGTGKELIAGLVHASSGRASGPLVRFNCAAIPRELAEAELFGHARGAFTGAARARRGFFAEADGGTLVLDEIGELSRRVQATLLRALQDGEIQPVGAGRVEKVDVRVIASTNCDLAAAARDGRFREDLYYRLAVVELLVPPLSEHAEDIPALATEFARSYGQRYGVDGVRLSPGLIEALHRASWPGNVRQLENTVARLVAMSGGGEIGADAFNSAVARVPGVEVALQSNLALKDHLDAVERSLITQTLSAVSGNQSEAARRLKISRSMLIDRLKKYRVNSTV